MDIAEEVAVTSYPFVASWSGGKDSAMAYYRALKTGARPERLLTMFEAGVAHSKSHALSYEFMEAQAHSLQVPLLTRKAEWQDYETQFLDAMQECKEAGINHAVFGDIDIEAHRSWVKNTCAKVGMRAVHPLWLQPRRHLLEELISLGFEAYVIVVNTKVMPARFIGRRFTLELMAELEALGIDSCGEAGEFHTVVVDGPIFSNRIAITFGEQIARQDYVFLRVGLA